MRIDMSQDLEVFKIGSIVNCTTCYSQKIEGEVLAFDEESKFLVIKSLASNGKSNLNDVRMLNLALLKEIKVLKTPTDPPAALPLLNIPKIQSRIQTSLQEKRRQVAKTGVGVTPEAQRLFNSLVKTLEATKWCGEDIVVMDVVTVRPPYAVENCSVNNDDPKSKNVLDLVQKIVLKHHKSEDESRKSASPSVLSSSS